MSTRDDGGAASGTPMMVCPSAGSCRADFSPHCGGPHAKQEGCDRANHGCPQCVPADTGTPVRQLGLGAVQADARTLPLPAEIDRLRAELSDTKTELHLAHDRNTALHRRCQKAESALPEWREIAGMAAEQRTGRFVPACMAVAMTQASEENDRLRAALARAEQERVEYQLAAEQYHKERDEARAGLREAIFDKACCPLCLSNMAAISVLKDRVNRWRKAAGMEA